ncbi:MAG: isochorismatase family protein [Christensenellales bacterium]
MEICGTDIDACCLAIAFNLFDNNIRPIILSDLCASSTGNKDIHSSALKIMERQFGSENIK